jgi:ABC-type lipoprotein export system ATPase subunit
VTASPVVDLVGVSRSYGTDPPIPALTDANLTIHAGECLAISGPSGSGKSTLLNLIGLLDRQTSGTYRFRGEDVNGLDDLERAGLRGRGIGFVFQAFHLLAHRTVIENVMLTELYLGEKRQGRRARALDALDRVGIADRADSLPTKLSGGQRQRVAIARAVMGSPSLLLCDEPTGNLDSGTAHDVLDLFEGLWRDGMTVAIITHDPNVARRAPRQVQIVDGRLSALGADR